MVHRTLIPALAAAALLAAPLGAQSATHKVRRPAASTARASSVLSSAGWTPVYTDASVTVSLGRAGTHRRSDGTYDAHLKWAYAKNMAIGRNKSYRTLVEHRYIDCKTLASKPVSGQTYDAADASVSTYTTSARDLRYVDWATRPAGSSGAKAYAAVCAALGSR
jgi:hypothetical protein